MRWIVIALALFISACAGELMYEPPSASSSRPNLKQLSKSKDAVWDALIPALSKQFFVINNLDKSSGLINVSYSGDPLSYVDCGMIHSYVKNARGERNYNFPASKTSQSYEVMVNGQLFGVRRNVSLEGRMNIIVSQADQ